jgi:hypothetical protein
MDKKFPWPNINKIIEPNSDKQMVSVPLEQTEIGGRTVSQAKDIKNSMTIKHIKNEG